MADPAKHYNELVAEENARLHRLARGAEIPRYSPKDKKLSREDEGRDYQMTANTPDGFRVRLKEGKEQFGLVQAANDLLDWDARNRG